MQCSRCGATVRSGMTECPKCGAPLAQSSGGGFEMYRPQQGYVPGGGAPQQPEPHQQPAQPPQQRPLGSLQRRLQRSQASAPNDDLDDDVWGADEPPARPGDRRPRSRPLDRQSDGYGSRRSSGASDDGYGSRGRRSRPVDDASARRGSRGGRSRADYDDYDGDDESREEPAYSPYPAYDPDRDDSREYSAWDASREEPAYEPPRRRSAPERYRPVEDSAEMSAEMSAEGPAYEPPRRATPQRRSRPSHDQRGAGDDYTNPLDDPRSPLRGGQGRRPSQGSSGRGRRSADDYPPPPSRRPVDDYAGYTEGEMDARRYPDYADDYGPSDRGAASGRGPRGWGGGYPEPYERDEDDYASREGWAAPGGQNSPYSPYSPEPYGQARRGVAFNDSAEVWQPGAAAYPPSRPGALAPQPRSRPTGGARSGAKPERPAKQRKGGAIRTAISLLTTLALIAAVGVEFGPKLYHLALTRGLGGAPTQAAITCASEATPSAKATPAAGLATFATTAYALTYPASWQRTTRSDVLANQCDVAYTFAQSNGAAQFMVEQAGAFSPLSDQQVIQAEAQTTQQQSSTFTEITSAATTQSIGGEVWQRREYQATTKSGVKLHLAVLAGRHNGAGFAIILLSSDTGFSRDDTTTFEPMLRSFQFA